MSALRAVVAICVFLCAILATTVNAQFDVQATLFHDSAALTSAIRTLSPSYSKTTTTQWSQIRSVVYSPLDPHSQIVGLVLQSGCYYSLSTGTCVANNVLWATVVKFRAFTQNTTANAATNSLITLAVARYDVNQLQMIDARSGHIFTALDLGVDNIWSPKYQYACSGETYVAAMVAPSRSALANAPTANFHALEHLFIWKIDIDGFTILSAANSALTLPQKWVCASNSLYAVAPFSWATNPSNTISRPEHMRLWTAQINDIMLKPDSAWVRRKLHTRLLPSQSVRHYVNPAVDVCVGGDMHHESREFVLVLYNSGVVLGFGSHQKGQLGAGDLAASSIYPITHENATFVIDPIIDPILNSSRPFKLQGPLICSYNRAAARVGGQAEKIAVWGKGLRTHPIIEPARVKTVSITDVRFHNSHFHLMENGADVSGQSNLHVQDDTPVIQTIIIAGLIFIVVAALAGGGIYLIVRDERADQDYVTH